MAVFLFAQSRCYIDKADLMNNGGLNDVERR